MNQVGPEGKGESVWLAFFLYDGLIQLFDPPFDTSDLEPGYIKGYMLLRVLQRACERVVYLVADGVCFRSTINQMTQSFSAGVRFQTSV